MRKKRIPIIFAVLFCLAVFGGTSHAAESPRLTVIATIFPLYDFAREIGKDKVAVRKLLPPGVEAHTFEPKPQDIALISRADVFIYTGRYMEPWVEDLLKGVAHKDLAVVDTSKGIELMDHAGHEDAAEHRQAEGPGHHHESAGKDPHIWLNLAYAQKMAQTIAEAMAQKDPQNKDFYLDNAGRYKAMLADLDARLETTLSTCKIKTIVYAGHFAFGYFSQRYGLEHVSPYRGFSPDAEPSPKSIKELIDMIKKTGSKYIYYEELIDPRVAKVISEETGAQLMLLHGAHNVSPEELAQGVTFLSIMEEDLKKLRQGLECQ